MELKQEVEAAVEALNSWDGTTFEAAFDAIAKVEAVAARATRERPPESSGPQWFRLLRLSLAATASLIEYAADADAPEAERAQLGAIRSRLATAALFRVTAGAIPE